MKRLSLSLLAAIALTGCMSTDSTPKKPGTEYLGADVLWRPREWLIFNMLNEQGKGFDLTFTVRDMNTYVQAPAPVFFFVIGPDSRILVRQFLEDDGITGGDFKHQDGIYDPFADFRYRQWHRANSPGGMPAHKTRSPYLEHPKNCRPVLSNSRFRQTGRGFTGWSWSVVGITGFRCPQMCRCRPGSIPGPGRCTLMAQTWTDLSSMCRKPARMSA